MPFEIKTQNYVYTFTSRTKLIVTNELLYSVLYDGLSTL